MVFSSIETISPFARLRVKKYFEKSVKYFSDSPSSFTIVVFAFYVEERVTVPPSSFKSCNTTKGIVVLLLKDASSNFGNVREPF